MTETAHRVEKTELSDIIAQIESSNQRIANEQEHKKEIKSAAKAKGYDVTAIDVIIKQKASDPNKVADLEAALDLYKSALGM